MNFVSHLLKNVVFVWGFKNSTIVIDLCKFFGLKYAVFVGDSIDAESEFNKWILEAI